MSRPATIDAIVEDAADAFGVSIAAMVSPDRLVHARFAAVWVAHELDGASYAAIGRALGDRSHGTIRHAYRRAQQLRETDPVFAQGCDALLGDARRRAGG